MRTLCLQEHIRERTVCGYLHNCVHNYSYNVYLYNSVDMEDNEMREISQSETDN